MKTGFLFLILLLISAGINGQQRDLDYYLEQAKSSSPLINKSKNDSRIADLDLQQMRAVLSKPEVNLVSGIMLAPIISHDNNANRFMLGSNDAVDYNGYDIALTDGGAYQAMVSVRQPLLSGSKIKSYQDKAALETRINENNIALTVHELEQVVAYQYLLCLQSRMQIENSLQILNEVNDQLNTLNKLVDKAVYKKTDLMLLEIEAQTYEADHKMYKAAFLTNLYDLNLICGINDTASTDLRDMELQLNAPGDGDSKFLTSYQLDSMNLMAEQAISELKYKPQLDLFADAGLNASYMPAINRIGFSTGLTFSMNIFDGRQREMEKKKTEVSISSISFEKNNFITKNEIGKNKILGQIKAADERINLLGKQSEQYRKLSDAYKMELSQGEASVMDLKNLMKDIASNKEEIILLKMEKQLLINSYNYLNY